MSAGIFEDGTIISEDSRRSPKVFRRRPKSVEGEVFTCFSLQKSEIARKVLSFIHFTHGFRSLHGSELTYFWKLCQARRQQLTFFDQAWEIGPQAWAGVRSKFSTRGRETHAQGVRVGRYTGGSSKITVNVWRKSRGIRFWFELARGSS